MSAHHRPRARTDRFGEPVKPQLRLVPIADHERLLECNGCRALVTVGGWVDDLNPNTYRCIDCRIATTSENGA